GGGGGRGGGGRGGRRTAPRGGAAASVSGRGRGCGGGEGSRPPARTATGAAGPRRRHRPPHRAPPACRPGSSPRWGAAGGESPGAGAGPAGGGGAGPRGGGDPRAPAAAPARQPRGRRGARAGAVPAATPEATLVSPAGAVSGAAAPVARLFTSPESCWRLLVVSLPCLVRGKVQLWAALPGLFSQERVSSLPPPDLALPTPPTSSPCTLELWIFFQSGFFLVNTRVEETQVFCLQSAAP